MFQPFSLERASTRPDPQLLRSDLCAQLAPLNRYGLAGFSSALVDGVRALIVASRRVHHAGCCADC
jgi:hypothetical protein